MGMKADGNLYIAAQFLDTFDEIGKQVEKGAAKISNNTKIDLSLDEKNILKEINSMLGSTKFKDLDLSDIVSSVFASISKEGMSSKDRTKILDDFQYNLRMFHTAPLKTIKQLKGVKSEDLTEILQEIQTDSLSDNPKRQWTSSNLKNNIKEIIDEHLKTVIDNTVDSIQETLVQEFGKDTAKYGVSGKEANNRLNNIYDSLVQEADKQSKQYKSNVDLSEIVSDNDLKNIQGFYSRIESLGEIASDKAKKLVDMLTSMSNNGAIEEELDDIIYQISEDVNSFTEKEKQLIQETKQQQKEIDELNAQNKSSSKQKIKPNFNAENQERVTASTISQSAEKENKIQETKTQQQENKKIIEQANEITTTESKTVDIKKQQTQEIEKQNNLLKEQKQIEDNTGEVDEYQTSTSQNQVQQEIQETTSTSQSAAESNKQLAESIQEVTQAAQQEEQILSKSNDSIMYHFGNFSKNRPSHQFGDEKRAWFKGIEDSGRGWADGTGTYVSNHLDEYSPAPISDKSLLKFYSIDVSKLKLYEAHTEEQAEQFYNFIHHIEQYCIKIGSGFEGFDDNLKNIDVESLYKTFKKVFPEAEMTIEQFNDFISRMSALVSESSLDKEGNFNPQKMFAFKKKYGIDDIKTRLLKELGYQGTNLSGTSYGGLQSGNVLFDDYAKIFTITSGKQISEVAKQSEEIVNNRNEILKKRGININSFDLIGLTPEQLKQINDLLLEIYNSENRLSTIQKGSKIESAINDKITLNKNKIQEIINNKNNQSHTINQETEKNTESAKDELRVEQQLTNEFKEQKDIKQASIETSQKDNKESELQTIKEIKKETQQVVEQQQKVAEAKQETLQTTQEELKTEQQLSIESQKQEKTEEQKPAIKLKDKGKKLADVQKHGKSQAEIDAQLKANEEKKKKNTSTSKVDLEEKERVNNAAAADAKADEEKQRQQAIEDQNFLAALRAKYAEAEARQAEKEAQKIQLTAEQMQKLKQGIQEAADSLKEYKEIDEQIIQAQKDRNSFIQLSSSTAEETLGLTSAPDLAEYIRGAYRKYKKTGNEDDEKRLQESLRKYFMPRKTKWSYEDDNGQKKYVEGYTNFQEKFLTQKNGKDISTYIKDKKFQEYIEQAKKQSEAYEKAQHNLPELEYQKMSGQEKFISASSKIQQLLQEAGLDADKVNKILAAINGNLTNEEAIWKVINSYIKEASEELDKQKELTEKTGSSVLEKPKEDITSKNASENKIEQTDITGQEEKNQQAIEKTIELTEELQEQTQELTAPKTTESSVISQIGEEAKETKQKVDEVVESVKNVGDETKKQSISKKTDNIESEFSEKTFARSYIQGSTPPFKEAKHWIDSGVKTDNIEKLKTYYQQYENIVNKIKSTKETPETKPKFKAWAEEYNKVRESVISVIDAIKKVDSEENKILSKQKAQKDIIKGTINDRAGLARNAQKNLDSNYYDKQIARADTILSQYTPTESLEAAKAIEQANNALDKYKSKVDELKRFSTGDLELDKPFEELIEEVNKAGDEVKELTKNIQDNFSKVANSNSITDFATRIKTILNAYKRITPENKQKLENIFGSLEVGKTTTKQLADANSQVKSILADEKELGNLSSNIFDRMYGKMQEGIAFLATKFSFYQIFNQFRQGFEVIHQFDDALTEMMKVSDETRLSLERYQKTTFDTADAIGTNALQLQNSTADFMRLGESLDQAAESARTANVLMNVSEFQSIDEATESLIAMGAAYDDLSKMNIIDKLNEVGNNYAISTSEAATALQASASALQTAGNNMDEALALITAGNAVVQDATKVGAGMRTIALRLTGTKSAKEELEEMGEETENVITTQSKLRDTIKEATAVASNGFKGFDILDENGNYKSTYEIMLGIADVYDEIAETDKQFGRNNLNLLLESVAGKNRANIAASIFQNPELLRKAYASSEEANGSAMRENDKYVQSISGHLAQLTNAWQEMWANAANRDVINFFIDAAKAIVNFANAVGIIPSTAILGVPFLEMISKARTGKGVVSSFFEWAAKLPEAKKALEETAKAQATFNQTQEAGVAIDTAKVASTKAETEANIEGAAASAGKTVANEGETASTLELTGAEVGETIAEKGSTAADIEGTAASAGKTAANLAEAGSEATSAAGGFGQLGAAIGGKFAAGIGRITGAVSGLVGAIGIVPTVLGVATGAVLIGKKIYDAHRESVLADAKAVTENIKTQQDTTAQQIESYKQLKQQLDSGDLSEQETLDIKQKILDIQKTIADQYGVSMNAIDLVNGKLEDQLKIIQTIGQTNAENQLNENSEGFKVAEQEYNKNRKYSFKMRYPTDDIRNILGASGFDLKQWNNNGTIVASIEDDVDSSIKKLNQLKESLIQTRDSYTGYRSNERKEAINSYIEDIDKELSKAEALKAQYEDTYLQKLFTEIYKNGDYGTYQNYQSSVSNLENAYVSGDTKKINEARKAFDEATKAKEDFLEIKGNEQFTLLFDKIDTSLIDTKNKFRDTVELLKDIPQPDSEEGLFETEYTKRIDKNTKAKKKNGKETDKVHKAAEKLYKLNPDKVDIKATLDNNTYASGKYADALNTLMNEMGWTTAEADDMINALVTAGIVHGDASDIAYIATDSYNVFSSSVENAVAALSSLNTALSESAKGTGLTEQTLTELRNAFGDNLDSVLERTANGYHLNTEGAYLLRQQQEALVSADYASAVYEQYQALDKLQEGYNRAKKAGEDTSGFAQQRKAIQDNIDKLNEQLMTFNNTNSAYQTWLAKQSSEGEREMYNSIYSGYDAVKDELDRGWAGEKTRSWLDLIFNDENDDSFDAWTSSAEKVKEKFKEVTKDIEGTGGYSIADFFTVDGNGKSTSLGVWNFFDAIENKQKEVGKEFIKIGKDGEKIFDFTKNGDYQIADLLGMDIESVHAVLRAAADAGFEIHLDQPLFSLEQLTEKATAAKKALEETSGTKLKINLDPQSEDEVDSAMQKLTDYQQVLSEDTSIDPKVKTEKLQQLADIMNFLAAKKREFVEGKVFDIKLLDSKELEKSKKDINDITNKLSNYSKTSGKTEFADQFTIDPMLLNNVDYLQSKMETLKEIKPNVDDTQVQYLDQLLAQLQYRINILNDSNIGETVTVDQLMAAEQIVGDINTKLDYAAQHKDIEFNWDADEEFKEDLNTIASLPEEIKQKWGLEPDATGEELLELAKKGELHINVEATGNVPKAEDFQPSTPQKGSTITNTEIEEIKYNVSAAMDTTVFDQGKQHVDQGVEETNQKTAKPKIGLDNDTFIEKQNDSFVALEELDKYDATPNVTLTGLGGVVSVAESMKSTISSIKGKTVDVVVNATSNGLSTLKDKVQGAINKINELKNKKVDFANGTAHAYGTAFARGSVISGSAFASGDWGTSKDQTALTGELGTEIVVFPDGHWQTVGDTGAEFVHLPKGSIVFNHKQSEELLENGYVTSNKGRGKLVGFASGTAFSYGTDKGAIKPTVSSKGMGGSTTSKNNNKGNKDTSKDKTKHKKKNNNTTNKEANKTKNTLDEVEILISRIERQIANLDKTIGNTYTKWSTRNSAIKSDLTKVAQEIKDQNKAYTTYIKKANSVGLPAAWKKKVQSGKFKIEDVTDDKLWQKIQDYKTYYEKALQSKDAVIDLKEKEGELYKQRFDNEQTYYEELIGDLEHTKNLLESYNDKLSESGKLGSQLLIRNQIAKENENIRLLNKEYNALITQRNEAVKSGKIKKYSEAWYEMEQSIQEVSESIAEAQNNVITLGNNIRQLDWDRWDKIHDAIGGVNNELEFLYDLFNSDDFFDEQGNLTDQGVAGFALLAQQYDTYFREAQEYQKEIEATEALLSANNGKDKYDQNLVDKLKDLKEAQQDSISSARKMKDSMVDLTEDGIKKQIDYIKDLIEDYEDLLETQKDQIDYAKKIGDQQKELNKLEKQYRAIQNDTSEEGATERQKLRDQINEKRQDLKDTQEDRRISETKDMLSDFEESFEDFLNNKLKDVEGIVQEVINRTNANGSVINDTITALANSYGYTPSDTLKNTLTDLSNNLVSYFNGAFDNENVRTIASGVDEIVKYYQEAQNKSEEKAGTLLQEQMKQRVKETGTHMQTYTDINGNTRTGFFNDNGTQDTKHSGWVEKDGKQYLFTNGTIEKKNQWYTGANGKKYYLDQNGARATGVRTVDGKTYFFGSNGARVADKKGWVTSGNNKYYFNKGIAYTGWKTINKKKYYFNENGAAYKGLKTIKGKKYYFDSNGVLYTGWRTISNKRYYFGTDGAAYTGWKTIDKQRYYFDANGAAYKGLKTIGKKKYYFDSNGVLLKGTWRKINNKQYYLDKKDGHVLTGKQTIDGKKYTFNADGTLKKKGWKKGTASVPKTGMAWTNEGYKSEAVIRKSDGAILTPLNKGDSVIPNSAMKNMYRALTDPEKYLKQYTTPDVKIIQGTGSTNNQSPTINMQFIANGVQDANKFVNDLMNNKKLEKWIQEVTLGQANGHNSYKKYSYAIR